MGSIKKEEEVGAPAEPPVQEVLLSEIRDLLKRAPDYPTSLRGLCLKSRSRASAGGTFS